MEEAEDEYERTLENNYRDQFMPGPGVGNGKMNFYQGHSNEFFIQDQIEEPDIITGENEHESENLALQPDDFNNLSPLEREGMTP